MKRFLVFILSFLYLGTSLGASVTLHYCMGNLIESSLFHDGSGPCSKCGMKKEVEKKNDCCKDEHRQIKLQDAHKPSSLFSDPLQFPEAALPVATYAMPEVFLPSVVVQHPFGHAPPVGHKKDTYIFNCTFRI